MKKRIMSLLLVCVLLCGTWSVASVHAYSETDIAYPVEGGNIYFDKETGTITGCDQSVTKAEIPSEIDGVAVTSIGERAFSYCTNVMSITIPDSVTSLGDRVFFGCSGMRSVTISNNVTRIGVSAFSGCSSLTNVVIPDGVSGIDGSAFSDCSSLASIMIPDSVTSIGYSAFRGCRCLTSVSIPSSVMSIGSYAFENTAMYYSEDHWIEDVFYIDNWLIEAKNSVEGAYTVRSGTVGIADSAFSNCRKMTSLSIPKEVVSIGSGYAGLHFCRSLVEYIVAEENTSYASKDGVLFNKDMTTLLSYPICKTNTEYTIPDGVANIDDYAFSATTIENVTIPNTVRHIGRSAFSGSSLINVLIPDGVICIDSNAFAGCDNLSSVVISDTVTSIGEFTFDDCGNLASVIIGNGMTSIDRGVFDNCASLVSVTIPESVTSIGPYAFSTCSSLTNIDIPHSVTSIEEYAFHNCKFTSVLIPESVTYIGNLAFFSENATMTSVYFMGDAPEIGLGAFKTWGDHGLTDIPGLTLYYIEGKEGWTSPTWNGYPTATWVPHEHSYVDTVTAPTCTEKGYTTHTCECGDNYIDTYVDALGHDFGEWTQTEAPNCTETGEEKRICSRCEAMETRELAALGHSYEDGVCVRCGEKEPQPPVEFVDVPKDEWYFGAVEYVAANGLMNGVGNGKFDPEGTMTRAMLVTVLWRYEGEPKAGANTFSDVPNGTWYTEAVAWAAANGIVGGIGNNRFDPEGKITREQMATILFRYANKKGIDVSKRGDLTAFPDGDAVESWAQEAMQWTVAEGIIGGSDGKLLPQGNATRAQVATILMRYIENIVKK